MSNERRQYSGVRILRLVRQPTGDDRDDVSLFVRGQRAPGFDCMPFGKASPTARGGGVLGDEDGMAAHRRLLSIVARDRRREPFSDERGSMSEHRGGALRRNVFAVTLAEREAATKARLREGVKELVEITHGDWC
jgi:hypothetical protein